MKGIKYFLRKPVSVHVVSPGESGRYVFILPPGIAGGGWKSIWDMGKDMHAIGDIPLSLPGLVPGVTMRSPRRGWSVEAEYIGVINKEYSCQTVKNSCLALYIYYIPIEIKICYLVGNKK